MSVAQGYPISMYVLRAIQHPNILCLLGTIRDKSSLMIVTNYVDGTDLQSIIFNEANERVCSECFLTIVAS